MGVCGSKSTKPHCALRMLIAGPALCGKTTISKQMQIVNCSDADEAFDREERQNFKSIIFMNVIEALVGILGYRRSRSLTNSDIEEGSNGTNTTSTNENGSARKTETTTSPVEKSLRTLAKLESKARANGQIHSDVVAKKYMKELFDDAHFVEEFKKDLAPISYFIHNSDRLLADNYEPTNDDILRARQRTAGFRVTKFTRDKYNWELYDVGGQINERRKWPDIIREHPCIATLFCASLGDMDAQVLEGKMRPLFDITVELFDSMVAQEAEERKTIVLFLNKTDIFKDKLKSGEIKMKNFPKFKGENTYENGVKYFEKLFTDLAARYKRNITIHATCALDTEQARIVLDSIMKDIVATRLINSDL